MGKGHRSKKRQYIRLSILVICLLAISSGYYFLFIYGSELSGRLLKETVATQSDGQYQIDFEEVSISIRSKELLIRRFHIAPTDTISPENARLYDIRIPELRIKVGSIAKIYLDKELVFRKIGVTDPEIKITKIDATKSKSTLSIESGDLYKLIDQYLFKFSIDSLGIDNAMVHYKSNNDHAGVILDEIDFAIKNLSIDSTSSKFLYTDDIQLSITNQEFLLDDSIHNLKFDEFRLSTKSQDILFSNISIKQYNHSYTGTDANIYNIEIPELNFRGIDFENAYKENHLILDSVRLYKPKFTIRSRESTAEHSRKDLPKLFFKLFKSLEIGQFFITDGMVDFSTSDQDHHEYLMSEHLNVTIEKFKIDSTHLAQPLSIAYFDHFELTSSKLRTQLRDSSHQISADYIGISTQDSTLRLSGLKITPKNTSKSASWTDMTIPNISLDGFDFARAWLTQSFSASSLILTEPRGTLHIKTDTLKPNRTNKLVDLYLLDTLLVINGEIGITSDDLQLSAGEISFHLSNIKLDPDSLNHSSLNDLLVLTNLTSRDVLLHDEHNELRLDKLSSERNMRFNLLEGVFFKSDENEHPLIIKSIGLNGFDLDALFDKNLILFDTLSVHAPNIDLDLTKKRKVESGKINNLVHMLSFNKVLVSDGQVNLYKNGKVFSHLDSISASLSSFHYDSLINEYFTGIDLRADSFHISMPDIQHSLSGRSITISQNDSTLDIHDLSLVPYPSDSAFNQYLINSPELKLQHLNFHKLLNTGEVEFQTGMLTHPQIAIRIEEKNEQKKNEKKTDPVKFGSFHITDGNLIFLQNTNDLSIESARFNLVINDFDMLNDTSLLFAQNYLFDAGQTTIGMKKLKDSIRIDRSLINSKEGHAILKNVSYVHDDDLGIQLPLLEIKGLNTDHLIDQNVLKMDSFLLSAPSIRYGLHTTEGKPKSSAPPTISVKGVKINNGYISLYDQQLNHGDSLRFYNIDLMVNGFTYDSLVQVEFTHHLFQSLDVSGHSFSYTLPDSLFRFDIGKYSYDHTAKIISIDDIKLTPLYNKGEFQSQIDHQKDWLDGSVKRLVVNGFELDSLINHKKIQSSGILIDQFWLDTHRDKRLPREENIYKPLPQSMIRNIPYRLAVDSIQVLSSYVSHSEFSETGDLPGLIYFKNINASIRNITNDPKKLAANPTMEFEADGSLMNSGGFTVNVAFDLADTMDAYVMNGRVGEMDLPELNEFLEHTAYVKIRSGAAKEVLFAYEANENYSIGEMTFFYDDLKISVLDQDSYDTQGFGSSIKTFFANTFVVNTRNPHFIFVRDGDIFHERDKAKSIFNYWAKSLLSGVVTSIGAKNSKKEIKKQNKEVQAKFEQLKKRR